MIFEVANMSFNAFRENKILEEKISEFTVQRVKHKIVLTLKYKWSPY